MILAGSARMLSGCACSGTAAHCLVLSHFRLPRRARPPSPQGVHSKHNAFSDDIGDREAAVEPPASRNNGDPGATSSNTLNQHSASPPNGDASTQEQLDSIQDELNKLRKSLGTQSAASQQQLLSINSLERQAFRRASTVPRTNLPQGLHAVHAACNNSCILYVSISLWN